jgi:DNA-binding MarR family transcriptional regulator/GNAT superfamily N-acetyltransferase
MDSNVPSARIDAVRQFNRLYTKVIGALDAGLVHTPYSLTEARLLYELFQREVTEVADLRGELDLDAGYLSRLLSQLASDGLVIRDKSATDSRRQVVRLTTAGVEAATMLTQRATAQVRDLLGTMAEPDQRALVDAMRTISQLINGPSGADAVVLRPPRAGDYGWVIERHGALYAKEYGWDATFEALVATVVADYIKNYDSALDASWIAEVAGRPVGCVFCVHTADPSAGSAAASAGPKVAKLRLLLVEPSARGLGVGTRLVDECIRFARSAGYRTLTLWTNDVLVAARRIYERAGFQLVSEERHHSFGHELIGENWELQL